jgi:hypothetical protein
MQLRAAFSSFFLLVVVLRGRSNLKRQDCLDAQRGHAAPDKTDADGLAVAVVLTLEFAEIANVRMRLDDVTSLIVNANHCIMGTAERRENRARVRGGKQAI